MVRVLGAGKPGMMDSLRRSPIGTRHGSGSMGVTPGSANAGRAESWLRTLIGVVRAGRPEFPPPSTPDRGSSLKSWWLPVVGVSLLLYTLMLAIAVGAHRQVLAREQHLKTIGAGVPGAATEGWLRGWALSQFALRPARAFSPAASPTEAVAWSPDGNMLATGSGDGTVAVWQADDDRLRWAVRPVSGRISSLSWSADGKHIVAGGAGTMFVLLDVRTARTHPLLAASPYVAPSAAYSPDGRWLALAPGSGGVQVWAANGAREPHYTFMLAIGSATTGVAWSADSRLLAVGSMSGAVQVWDVGTLHVVRSLPAARHGPVWSLQWSPRSRQLALGWADGHVEILAGPGLVQTRLLQVGGAINTLAWSADGTLLAVTAVGAPLELWDVRAGTLIRRTATGWDTNQVAWSSDGRTLVAGTDGHDLRVWRLMPPADGLGHQLCRLQPTDCAPLAGHIGSVPSYMGR